MLRTALGESTASLDSAGRSARARVLRGAQLSGGPRVTSWPEPGGGHALPEGGGGGAPVGASPGRWVSGRAPPRTPGPRWHGGQALGDGGIEPASPPLQGRQGPEAQRVLGAREGQPRGAGLVPPPAERQEAPG